MIKSDETPYWLIEPIASKQQGRRVYYSFTAEIGPVLTSDRTAAKIFSGFNSATEASLSFGELFLFEVEVACLCDYGSKGLCAGCESELKAELLCEAELSNKPTSLSHKDQLSRFDRVRSP